MGQAVLVRRHLVPDPLSVLTFDHAWFNYTFYCKLFCEISNKILFQTCHKSRSHGTSFRSSLLQEVGKKMSLKKFFFSSKKSFYSPKEKKMQKSTNFWILKRFLIIDILIIESCSPSQFTQYRHL